MTINYTTLLGLAKPVTGTESGAWGDVVNDQITSLVEDAIANAASISVTAGNVTLTDNNGSSDQARMAILLVTGSPGVSRNIVAPSTSKWYIVKNGSNAEVVLKGSATTGVTIPAGAEVLAFWNGSDFEIAGMVGPSTSTDNAVARFDGTTGKVVQNSSVVIDDSNNITGIVDETLSGNLNFTGSAKRITGDFTNATIADRLMFQTSTANSNTSVSALPSGTATVAAFNVHNNSDPTNSGVFQFLALSTEMRLNANAVGSGSSLPLTIYTGGSERMRITTSGDVGIGTSSPSTKLHVVGGNATVQSSTSGDGNIRLTNTGASYLVGMLGSAGSTALSFYDLVASAERMRLDTSGNVGIGTSSPNNRFVVSNSGAAGFEVNPSTGNIFTFNRSTSLYTDMTLTSNNMIFQTGGASERMRIDTSGNLLVGTTSSAGRIAVAADSAGAVYPVYVNNTNTGSTSQIVVDIARNGVRVGSISNTNAVTAYNTSSDYRLKENVKPMQGALATVAQLKPCTYTWKIDGSAGQGFIAHELAEVVPNAVSGDKDELDTNGKPKYQGVDYGKITPLLTAALQEAMQKIAALEARIVSLEAK